MPIEVIQTPTLTFAAMARPIKEYEYIVVFKRKSTQLIDIISQLMLAVAIGTFLFQIIYDYKTGKLGEQSDSGLLIFFVLITIAWWLYCKKREKRGLETFYRFALMAAAWGFWMLPSQMKWVSILYLIGSFLEKPIKKNTELAFDDNEVVMNSFPLKKHKWNEFNNIILKDGLLTLDFKNNRIIQKEVNDDVTKEIEMEFNAYCKQRLATAL